MFISLSAAAVADRRHRDDHDVRITSEPHHNRISIAVAPQTPRRSSFVKPECRVRGVRLIWLIKYAPIVSDTNIACTKSMVSVCVDCGPPVWVSKLLRKRSVLHTRIVCECVRNAVVSCSTTKTTTTITENECVCVICS